MFVSSAWAAWAASWPKSLASAGLKVVGFERGPAPKREDYAPRDSIRFLIRPEQLEWVRHEPTTTRSKAGDKTRVQYRTSPLNVLGGALLHWTGQSSRYMPGDFKLYTNEIESGNAERAEADLARLRYYRLAAQLRRS